LKSTLKTLKDLDAKVEKYDPVKKTIVAQVKGWGRDGLPARVSISNHQLGSRVSIVQVTEDDEELLEDNILEKLGINQFCALFSNALAATRITDVQGYYPIDWLDDRTYKDDPTEKT